MPVNQQECTQSDVKDRLLKANHNFASATVGKSGDVKDRLLKANHNMIKVSCLMGQMSKIVC